jgi:hypothetical protein
VLTLVFYFEGCLHRSADLTLVPSVAIAEDFETAKVVSGKKLHLICILYIPPFIPYHDSLLPLQQTEYGFGTRALILKASILNFGVMICASS